MKITPGAYPEETNWPAWITFTKGPEISRVFLYRLAAYVRDVVGAPVTMYGYRSYADQVTAYANYQAGGNIAAKPGTSWHGFGLAVDFNRVSAGVYPGTLNVDYDHFLAGQAETLNQYGLMHSVKTEPWHIQPIETNGYSGNRAEYLDSDDTINGEDIMIKLDDQGPIVYTYQQGCKAMGYELGEYKDTITGELTGCDSWYGSRMVEITSDIQRCTSLPITGEVDVPTYTKVVEVLLTKIGQPTGISPADLDAANAQIADLTGQLMKEQEYTGTLAADIMGRDAEAKDLATAIGTIGMFREKHAG